MSSTPSSPISSPPDISPSADSPSSNTSAPSPVPNPPTPTPPPTNSSAPTPSNSTTPPPANTTAPPPDSPPPPKPEPPRSPPSNGNSPPSPPSPRASPPPVTPPSPVAPPPRNNTPPAPPPNNPPRPSPPAPPPVIPPSPPAPPGQSPPAPPTSQPPPAPPPQSNTTVPATPASPSAPSTPSEGPPADANPPSPNNATGRVPAAGVIAIVLVGLLAIILAVFAAWFLNRRKKRRSGSNDGTTDSSFVRSQNTGPPSLWAQGAAIGAAHHSAHANGSSSTKNPASNGDPGGIGNSKPFFTYEELSLATNGFSAANLLGEGGFGCVYKGNLADGKEVAVKQLKIGGGQGEREFQAEVEIISRIHHRHLVSIVGYCISDFQRLLVYDYVPNNTLYYHLHENVSVMTWPTRFRVAAGAARGIAYLHEDCNPRIIHRDIKSSNILLDNNFEAKVADFGLAKLALELEVHTHVSTRVMGTFGYMAPEYATTGKLTEKSDVFSFGVVLLELITGRKPVDSTQQLGDESLVEWARPLLTQALESGSFENLVDPRLQNEYLDIEMFRLAEAAAACVRHSASKRPKMSQIVRAIDSISEVQDLTNGMKPGDSQIIDSREQSAQIRLFQRMAFGAHEFGSDEFSSSQSTKSGL